MEKFQYHATHSTIKIDIFLRKKFNMLNNSILKQHMFLFFFNKKKTINPQIKPTNQRYPFLLPG